MSKWISVKERLPGSGNQVIVVGWLWDGDWKTAEYSAGFYSKGEWHLYEHNHTLHVTHWMPFSYLDLPEMALLED